MLSLKTLKDVGIGIITAILTKLIVDAYVGYKNGLARLGRCPGRHRLWTHPFHTSSIVLASFFPPRGWMAHYGGKFSIYAKEGSTILSALVVWDATPMFWLADAEAIKTVTSDRHTFRKEIEVYDVLEIYGRNLVSTEGDEWRRHLAIAGPAFNEANYALAWAETLRVVHEWFEELDSGTETSAGKLIDVNSAMARATLLVISAAGFGKRAPWTAFSSAGEAHDNSEPSWSREGTVMPFHAALALTIEKLFVKVLTPDFAYSLPFRIPWLSNQLEEARDAFASLKAHMEILVAVARSSEAGGADLLRRLVKANDATLTVGGAGTKGSLTDGELFSNIFTFLLAGHGEGPSFFLEKGEFTDPSSVETSAHTLSFAIMLLALYPESQRKLREEVLWAWPTLEDSASSSSKKDFDRLKYTLAVFRETLRCFPSEPRLNKIVENDVLLKGTRFNPDSTKHSPRTSYDGSLTNVKFSRDESKDHKFSVHVPQGSTVTLDIWALHMNPLYWGNDAHLFRPERFIDTPDCKWPRDAFLPFSAGARGCIGQRFAATESVCLLACLARRYEILPPEGVEVRNMTESDKRSLLTWKSGVTIAPTNSFVRFRKYTTE